MRYFIHVFYICIISALICAFIMHKPEPEIKTIEVIKTIEKPVYRDYSAVSCSEALNMLKHYDNDKMIMQYDIKNNSPELTDLNIRWQLYDRKGEQEINVPVAQAGNFKLYLGIGLGAAAVSGLVFLLK